MQQILVKDTGRYDDGLVLIFPGFKMGEMNWIFQSIGDFSSAKDCLNKFVRVGQITGASIFYKNGERPSGPVDLCTFRVFS